MIVRVTLNQQATEPFIEMLKTFFKLKATSTLYVFRSGMLSQEKATATAIALRHYIGVQSVNIGCDLVTVCIKLTNDSKEVRSFLLNTYGPPISIEDSTLTWTDVNSTEYLSMSEWAFRCPEVIFMKMLKRPIERTAELIEW